MKKNVAGQVVGVDMVALDGSPYTGSTTVYVTGNNGTQAVGSVSGGAGAHKGNGYHSYVPSQAETNYDHIAFTFVGSGAVTRTVQMFTDFPQTGDNFTRLGAPSGASFSADLASIRGAGFNTSTDSLEALRDRGDLAWTGGGGSSLDAATLRSWLGLASANLDAVLGGISTAIGTLGSGGEVDVDEIALAVKTLLGLTGTLDSQFSSIKGSGFNSGTDSLEAIKDSFAGVATSANVTNTQSALTSLINTVDSVVDSIKVDTGTTLPGQIANISAPSVTEIVNGMDVNSTKFTAIVNGIAALNNLINNLEIDVGDIDPITIVNGIFAKEVESGESFLEALRLIRAEAAGLVNISGNTVNFRDKGNTKNRISATVDAAGQRVSVSTDAT